MERIPIEALLWLLKGIEEEKIDLKTILSPPNPSELKPAAIRERIKGEDPLPEVPEVPFSHHFIMKMWLSGFDLDFIPSGVSLAGLGKDGLRIRDKEKILKEVGQEETTKGRWVFFPRRLFLPGSAGESREQERVFWELAEKIEISEKKVIWPLAAEIAYLFSQWNRAMIRGSILFRHLLKDRYIWTGTKVSGRPVCVGLYEEERGLTITVGWKYFGSDIGPFACPLIIS